MMRRLPPSPEPMVWVSAVPLPYRGLLKRCQCGRRFLRMLAYERHYTREHVKDPLGLGGATPPAGVSMQVPLSRAFELGYEADVVEGALRARRPQP